MRAFLVFPVALLALSACASGNVQKVSDYNAPPPPHVRHPLYNPYAGYGETNATWEPPTYNRDGTIVKPTEPSSQGTRPQYELAPWATGAAGGNRNAPPGTF